MVKTRVQFLTVDGVLLRGDLFAVEGIENGPAVVMTQGLSLLKEHYIDDTAERFQLAGITALVYDHRGWGSSEGSPRGETNPLQQAEDYIDAVSYVRSLPGVDPNRVAIWGIGHSGGASLIATANDPRLKAVLAVMPCTSGKLDAAAFPPGTLEKAFSDRETKTQNDIFEGPDAYEFITGAKERSDRARTPWENKITLQSFHHIKRVEPQDYIARIAPRHLLYLAAVEDPLTGPLEHHKKVFEKANEPKELVVLNNHHLANYFGQSFEDDTKSQLNFIKRVL